MEYVRFNADVAASSLRRAADGQSVLSVEFNAIVALVGRARDLILSPGRSTPFVRVPSAIGESVSGELIGWTHSEFAPSPGMTQAESDERSIAAGALGYALRRLRTGRRIVGRDVSGVPSGSSWPLVALVGEPASAILPPTALSPSASIEVDASVARDAQDALRNASSILSPVLNPLDDSGARRRASWMSREYATSSGRTEALFYVGIAASTLVSLYLLGAFRRTAKAPQQAPGLGMQGAPSSPYGAPLAQPNWY